MKPDIKPFIFVAVFLVTAACASIQDKPTLVSFNTTAKANDIRDCINERLSGSAGITPYKDGWMIVKHPMMNNSWAIWQVVLTPVGGITHVEGKTMAQVDWDDDVAPCLKDLPRS